MKISTTILRYSLLFRVLMSNRIIVCRATSTDNQSMSSLDEIYACEREAVSLGTSLADTFNMPLGNHSRLERTMQNDIVARLGFAPWVAQGLHKGNGKTLSGDDAAYIHRKYGWIDKNVSESPYAVLNHKWVYMHGDSTTRQIWASYAAPFQGNHFERNAKEWTRQHSNRQSHRNHNRVNGSVYPEEGWKGPCAVNEVTCHVSGYGDEGLLTFDWKHFPYEEYDDYLWSEQGLIKPNSTERVPDIITVQFGIHTCFHSHPAGLYDHLKRVNDTMIDHHIESIPRLMKEIKRAVNRRPSFNIAVIIVTSGITWYKNGEAMDACIERINRAASHAAHEQGFAVLERGEIERRLMFKSMHSSNPAIVPEIHLSQPAPSIIATCLLQMLNCLSARQSSRIQSSVI